jgi:putative acyl-CoA dehydrogenase
MDATHLVLNQARAATGWNAFSDDPVLQGVVTRSAPWVAEKAYRMSAGVERCRQPPSGSSLII